MTLRYYIFILVALLATVVRGQDRVVENRPYTDLRVLHFGIHVGAHVQDMEFVNVGAVSTVGADGEEGRQFISVDQDRFDPGFNVGVLAELRLNDNFQLRVAPAIYFGSRHIAFHDNLLGGDTQGEGRRQFMKTAYVMTSLDLIFAAPRLNNHRVYLMAGVAPTLNLTSQASDIVRLRRMQHFAEIGVGVDQYLPFFKCRPELKFMFGLGNALDTGHYDELRDKALQSYARSVSRGAAKMIALTFYFE